MKTIKTSKMNLVARTAYAIYFYMFVWKKSDLTIFTKNELFCEVVKGNLNCESNF